MLNQWWPDICDGKPATNQGQPKVGRRAAVTEDAVDQHCANAG